MSGTNPSSDVGEPRFRKLRIAWSVACSIAAVLLVSLWISSYRQSETVVRYSPKSLFRTSSTNGQICCWYERINALSWSGGASWQFMEGNTPAPFRPNGFSSSPPTLTIPYWFALLCVLCAGVVAWPTYRFSLRTLLIATTLVAVVLGLAVWAAS
jgi:hypothetical protein